MDKSVIVIDGAITSVYTPRSWENLQAMRENVIKALISNWGVKSLTRALQDAGVDLGQPGTGSLEIDRVRPPMLSVDQAWYEYYRNFQPNHPHAKWAADWNLETMGDTDLGEPIVAPFSGVVLNAADYAGAWGLIVRVMALENGKPVVWMGSHFDSINGNIVPGVRVQTGDVVGYIGKGPAGMYSAHLHEQISVGEVLAPTAYNYRAPFVDPVEWYREHLGDDLVTRLVRKDNA